MVKAPRVVERATPEAAVWAFILSMTGTGILLSAIVAGLLMRFSPLGLIVEYGRTIWKVRLSLVTIDAVPGSGR